MWGRAPDLSPSGAAGSTIAPGAATLGLKRLPGQQLGPVSTNPWQRLDWGRKAGQGGGAGPLCWILYKEKRCEQCGLGFTVRPVGTKMLRLGRAKPGSWGSFWAILALVGLAAHAGEWAVGGVGVGGREEGQDLLALPNRARRGRCPASQASSLCLLGEGSLPQTRGGAGPPSRVLTTRRPSHCPLSPAAGARQRPMGLYQHSGPSE